MNKLKLKIGITFLCLCTGILGWTQNNNILRTCLEIVQHPQDFQYSIDSSEFSELKNPIFYSEQDYTDALIIDNENLHFIDFNKDGNNDIIYKDTAHHEAIILFAKKGNDFHEIWSFPGKLMDIKQGKETIIYVQMNSYACLDISMLIELTVHNDNSITENSIAYHNETKIENIETTFEQQIISGILRIQPNLNDQEKMDPCTGDLKKGNHLRIIDNKTVTIIKKQKDWLLVIYKENNRSHIGWIKN